VGPGGAITPRRHKPPGLRDGTPFKVQKGSRFPLFYFILIAVKYFIEGFSMTTIKNVAIVGVSVQLSSSIL